MSVEEGFWDGKVQCTLREVGGAVVLRGEDFPFLCFCSFKWQSFVEEGEEIEGLTVGLEGGGVGKRGGLGKVRIRDEGLAEWRGS